MRQSSRFAARSIASSARSSARRSRSPCARLPRGELLEGGADGECGQKICVVDRTNPGAAERLGLDQPQELKIPQRLAYRRLARTQLPRKPGLDQPLARLQLAAKDALEEDLLDLLPEDGSRDAHRW